MGAIQAGSAQVDITPVDSQFLFGYPHVERYSDGVHDPLFSSALCLSDGNERVVFVANDIILVDKRLVATARRRIAERTGVAEQNIMITATHTHSGPITVDHLSGRDDPIVPKADQAYVKLLEDGIVEAAAGAVETLRPAELGLTIADATGIGTNRRDPAGPSDLAVPVLAAREKESGRFIACMLVCSMHPTVLHEDSRLVSADFPGAARRSLQRSLLGAQCPVVYHTGPEGNQSPRHVTKGNTFEEAERIGGILAAAVEKVVPNIEYLDEIELATDRGLVDLPHKEFPPPADAERRLAAVLSRFEGLKETGAPRAEVRTAECDWFGAEETLTMACAFREGDIEPFYRGCLPAEVQLIRVGRWSFIGWPGEVFIEYSLTVKKRFPDAFIANLANGELQGYIVTREAAEEGGYEASNAMFDHRSGDALVEATAELLERIARG